VFFLSDDNFLLRFLRVKKFSLPMAQQMLLKYINFRQTFSHLVYNLDYLIPSVNELISNGLEHAKHYLFINPLHTAFKGKIHIKEIILLSLR
jgi:hypothetical protein